MRIIFLSDSPTFWLSVALLLAIIAVVALYQWLRPPALKKLLADDRYRQAVAVYAANLPPDEPTREGRRLALALAVRYLEEQHGISPEEAAPNVRLLAAAYDKEQSYELRHQAITFEQAGAHDLALEHFERAARWQEDNDPKDWQFLQGCIARVRRKARPG